MNSRTFRVYREILGESSRRADEIRGLLASKRVTMVNLIGSPGCGKTSLIERLADASEPDARFAVLEGDVETTRDAERLSRKNVEVSQIITGGGCHLEAGMVFRALSELDLDSKRFVIVENVGNLVCPAEFDIGEHAKVAVVSVTEGEDKPLKYPLLFREAKCCLITKTDLLPYLEYDISACEASIRNVNSRVPVFRISSRTGDGIASFRAWLSDLAQSGPDE
jgi:hydrogenase nickel incorporation protein HypB